MQHLRWEKSGRIFDHADEGKPNTYTWQGKVGQSCVDMGDGTFAPYRWDATTQTMYYGSHSCQFSDWSEEIYDELGNTLIQDQRFEVQEFRDPPGQWRVLNLTNREILVDQQDDHCTITRHHWDSSGNDLQIKFLFRPSHKVKLTFTLTVQTARTYRIRFQNTGIAGEPQEKRAVTKEGIDFGVAGVLFEKIWYGWAVNEIGIHSYTVETQAEGKKVDVYLGTFALGAGQTITISPTVWGPTSIAADADDGDYSTTNGWRTDGDAGGGNDFIYIDATTQNYACFSWTLPALSAGTTINSMYFRGYVNSTYDTSNQCYYRLVVEDVDPATQVVWSGTHDPHGATWIRNNSFREDSIAEGNWYWGAADTYPINLGADLQDLITAYGAINSGDRICLAGDQGGNHTFDGSFYAGIEDLSHAGTNEAELTITYTSDFSLSLNNATQSNSASLPEVDVVYSLEQEGYRFRNDDGDEATATWKANQDANVSLPAGSKVRLRMIVDATGDPESKNLQLEWHKKESPDPWRKVI